MESGGTGPVTEARCRACGSGNLYLFHHQRGVPVNSCLLVGDETEAIRFPTGELSMAFCRTCGFIQNDSFDEKMTEYSDRYEETQAFSKRFVEFARGVATDWVDRHDLRGKRVIEIGCGKGEFLTYMADAGIGSGIGIDPGVDPARIDPGYEERLSWVPGWFDGSYGPLEADAIVCRHTLEHVAEVQEFLTLIREALGDRLDTVLLFELPDTMRVLEEAAFWDVYYEHCSYFSEGSLTRLFQQCGFEVLGVTLAYDDQYLLLEARPAGPSGPGQSAPDDLERLEKGVDHFSSTYRDVVEAWQSRLSGVAAGGGRAVIWGASSKGVSFLVSAGENVVAAVDINPNKHGMYMAGTGHQIVAPEELVEIAPELVVVMNPIYIEEITADLARLGVEAEVIAV
ncbi:MAG: methyltransferase domain-containing protein [Actinobacteria bacterium]|nr:MAG: methyltransferase domain-containing protein [Actinomycetota bacterium]